MVKYPTTGAEWGDIDGSIVDQEDLQAEFDAKKMFLNGFDLQDTDTLGTIAFSNSTLLFTIDVEATKSNYSFWANNTQFTKTTQSSLTIPDTTGTYYIYFDNSGVLQSVEESVMPLTVIYENALVALVYWNKTTQKGLVGNERHGIRMSSSTHAYNHLTYGARYQSGINIDGLVDGSPTYTGTTSGYFWDEDIIHTVASQSTHPFIYKLGALGEWTSSTADANVGFKNSTTNVVFNEQNGSDEWVLTESGSATDYMIYFFIATPDINDTSIKKIIGQNGYSSRNNARNAIESELSKIVTEGLPSPEFIFLYAYIVRQNGDLEDLEDDSTYIDLRAVRGGAGNVSGSTSVAGDINTNTTNFNNNLSVADTNVQLALDTIDNLSIGGGGGSVQDATTLAIQATDEGTVAGNARGANAVDLQTKRSAATMVASGGNATIGGGYGNTASYYYSTVGGGYGNTVSGNNATIGGGYSNTASGGNSSTVGGGYSNTASGSQSTVDGGESNTASNTYSTVGGGYSNTASGSQSTVGGGESNTASYSYSTIGGGYNNTALGSSSVIGGGYGNTANNSNSTVGGGDSNTACGHRSTISGGRQCSASGDYSTIGGGYTNTAYLDGQSVLGGYNSSNNNARQASQLTMQKTTTDATPAEMFLDNSSARAVLKTASAWGFEIYITATNSTTQGETAYFQRKGLIYNNAGTVALEGAIQTIGTDFKHSNLSGLDVTIEEDDANNSLKVSVTGKASNSIIWQATIQLTEIEI